MRIKGEGLEVLKSDAHQGEDFQGKRERLTRQSCTLSLNHPRTTRELHIYYFVLAETLQRRHFTIISSLVIASLVLIRIAFVQILGNMIVSTH